MKLIIIAYTAKGAELGKKILSKRNDTLLYVFTKFADSSVISFDKASDILDIYWGEAAVLFISACGIAVRSIAPYIKSKLTDSAVVVIDELGKNFISLLSGHIGGANELALELSKLCGGNAVITTATDINGITAVDEWAVQNGLCINNPKYIKYISSAMLEGKPISVLNETDLLFPYENSKSDYGVYIGCKDIYPFKYTLQLVPKRLCIGVGCKRGTSPEKMYSYISDVFKAEGLLLNSVCAVASIDVKADEPAVKELADRLGAKLYFFSADELNAVKGEFEHSDFVMKTVGVGCVCERAAAKLGKIIVRKQSGGGITAAIGEMV